jgi:serpin B
MLISSALAALSLAAAAVSTAAKDEGPTLKSDIETLVKGNNRFAVKMYMELGADEGNLFFSPYSMSFALGMAYAGARGNTAGEMETALDFELGQRMHPVFGSLDKRLIADIREAGQKLNIANGLCLTGGGVKDDYKTLVKDDYGAEIFSGGLEEINGWVKNKTEGKIDKILESLEGNSACVLLNAIYFKGEWDRQFDKQYTIEAPFHVSPDRKSAVPLMFRKDNFKILDHEEFQAVSIPYKEKTMSMVILLPRENDGLPAMERRLTAKELDGWLVELDGARGGEISLYIPRFKLETAFDLAPPFKKLGMKDAFDSGGRADLTGIGGARGELFISQIRHKAYVEVNEEGTEAAAATVVAVTATSAMLPRVFRADHPFIFIIRDNMTGSILFMGRIVDPGSRARLVVP